MIVPYATLSANKAALIKVSAYVDTIDAQLIVDAGGTITAAALTTTIANFTTSSKAEIIVNSGLPTGYVSSIPAAFTVTIPTDLTSDADYVGIYASAAVVSRKAAFYESDKPYEPVAGETNGVVSEFSALKHSISNSEKNAIQALNVNVLRIKLGLGPIISSQNTLYTGGSALHPFKRSHGVLLTLWIKDKLRRVSESMLQRPNNLKTWNLWELKISEVLEVFLSRDGLVDFDIVTGRAIMTQDDINSGLMKAKVYFTPARPLESVTINLFVRETAGQVEADIQGGLL